MTIALLLMSCNSVYIFACLLHVEHGDDIPCVWAPASTRTDESE